MRTLLSLMILIEWKRNVEIIGNNCCSAVMWAARHMAHVLLQQMRNGRHSTCTIGTLTFWGGIAMHFPWNPTPRAAPSVVRGNFKPQASSSGLHLFSDTSLHKPKTIEHHFSYMLCLKTRIPGEQQTIHRLASPHLHQLLKPKSFTASCLQNKNTMKIS